MRAIMMTRGCGITAADLDLLSSGGNRGVGSLREALDEIERPTIIAALQGSRGNMSRSASEGGVGWPTLDALLNERNLQPAEFQHR